MSHATILGLDGAIARRLPNYEVRPQQLDMADAVAHALGNARHLMVEAGTGVGKSFAYLVPAIQAACASKEGRVVISTHTIGLQEQLVRKDIPFLQKVMPQKFSALLVKGRGNYLSRRRLRVAHERGLMLLTEAGAVEQLDEIYQWSERTQDGSRSDLEFRPMPAVWELVESDSSNCLGKRCPDHADCFYFKARRNIHNAKILIVNHALFFADLALRSLGKDVGILPKYQAVIFDEAHTLEDVAAEHLGLSITRGQMDYLLRRLFHERRGKAHGLLSLHGDAESWMQVHRTRTAVQHFFNAILDWRRSFELRNKRQGNSDTLRVRESLIVPDLVSEEFKRLAQHLDRLAEGVKKEEEQIELEAAGVRCLDIAARLQAWLGQKLPSQVYWIENSGPRDDRVELASAPIEVGRHLAGDAALFRPQVPSVILTAAATLERRRQGRVRLFQGTPRLSRSRGVPAWQPIRLSPASGVAPFSPDA